MKHENAKCREKDLQEYGSKVIALKVVKAYEILLDNE